ncbi:hypothetical protein FQN52_005349 [Onygenales sp. PD_12]|nr:hypothetical protein FQN52_005349 [Onygenales sp. PD_12]
MGEEHRTNTLHYGHLGSATYLPDAQVWEFSRKVEKEPSLTFYGHVKTPLAVLDDPNGGRSKIENGTPLDNKKEDVLLKARPELAPGLGLLGRYEVSSRAITAAVTKFDPQISNRLALGNAVDLDHHGSGDFTIPLAVLSYGDSATSIQLVELEDEQVIWPPEGGAVANVPTLRDRGKALWIGNAGPVQQICFAEVVDEKSTWLAVRFPLVTAVFRPQYRKLPISSRYDDAQFMREGGEDTLLDANPLLEISVALTGGSPHADVAFNPWYQQQMAIVDCRGSWSVWDIGKQHRNLQWHADRGPSGTLDSKEPQLYTDEHERDHYDGWAAIAWVGDVHRLLICDRRNIALYRTDTEPIQRHPVDLDIQRESEWILDVKRSQTDLSSIFVLTTTRVFWLHVNSDSFSSSQNEQSQEVSVMLSWRHFRDMEDTSLRLAPMLVQNEFSLVLYSRLNTMAQVFRFAFSPEDPSVAVSVTDPYLLPLPATTSGGDNAIKLPCGPYFSSIGFQQVADSAVIDPMNENKSLRLVKFIGQRTDLSIIESLYVARTEGGEETYEPFSSNSPRRNIERSARRIDDDFIVDDLGEPMRPFSAVRSGNNDSGVGPEQPLQVGQQGEDWVDLYSSVAAAGYIGSKGRPQRDEKKNQTFDSWIQHLYDNFGELAMTDSASSNSRTMLDILGSAPPLDDIDQNTRDFEEFLRTLQDSIQDILPDHQLAYLPMPYPSSTSSNLQTPSSTNRPNHPNITRLYDSLVRDWLFPLPGDVPNKIRMIKEKIIRNILMELILSRITLTRNDIPEQPTTTAAATITTSDSQGPFTQEDTYPSLPSSPPPPSSQLPSQPHNLLSLYTPLPTLPTLPTPSRLVATTLSHWSLSTDPSTYDYLATTQSLAEEEELESGSQSAARRRKRREARRRSRQLAMAEPPGGSLEITERAQGPTTPVVASSSQVPVVRTQSQSQSQRESGFGAGVGVEFGAGAGAGASGLRFGTQVVQSSQVTEEEMPMTQIERGAFGGRSAVGMGMGVGKKKGLGVGGKGGKKKRAAGF